MALHQFYTFSNSNTGATLAQPGAPGVATVGQSSVPDLVGLLTTSPVGISRKHINAGLASFSARAGGSIGLFNAVRAVKRAGETPRVSTCRAQAGRRCLASSSQMATP